MFVENEYVRASCPSQVHYGTMSVVTSITSQAILSRRKRTGYVCMYVCISLGYDRGRSTRDATDRLISLMHHGITKLRRHGESINRSSVNNLILTARSKSPTIQFMHAPDRFPIVFPSLMSVRSKVARQPCSRAYAKTVCPFSSERPQHLQDFRPRTQQRG